MKPLKKLSLKKEVIAHLQSEDQKLLKGGTYGDADLFGSVVTCTTKFNTGNCGKSKSCHSIICIPI